MSRVSDLENKVAALERNVGMLAELSDVFQQKMHYKITKKELI